MASVSTLLIITFFGINVILLELLVTRYRREIFNPGNSIAVASQAQQERCAVSISIYKISLSYFLSYFILFKFNMWVGNSTLILFLFSSLFLVILGVSFRPSYIPYLQAGQFNYTSFIFIILQLIFSCGLFISNLISFLLFLEVVSACYYFFFLTTQTIGQKQIIFFKNLFILYLFVSYLTMLSFSLGIALLSYSLGTCMFAELRLFAYTNTIGYWILLSSLGLKIGVPYFHFFKLELYQMLGFESLILFSIFSLYFNIFLYYFLCGVYLSLVAVNILGVVLLIGVGLLLSVRQFTSFAQFIAISGIITSITLLLFISLN